MPEENEHRTGRYAVYNGHTYRAFGDITADHFSLIRERDDDPVPEGLRTDPHDAGRSFYVTADRVAQWYSTKWTFRWRDEPFDAIGSAGGTIHGYYTGQQLWLVSDALEQEEASVWKGSFPLSEITDLTEHRTDLLAQWRERQQKLAAANWYQNGTFARYRGHTYAAYPTLSDGRIRLLKRKDDEPIPDGLVRDVRSEYGQTYLAEPDEVDRWFSSKWTFRAIREPFEAVGMHEGEFIGTYTGTNEEFARKYLKYLKQSSPAEYYRTFPVTAVDDLTEHRVDLLARWREEHPS